MGLFFWENFRKWVYILLFFLSISIFLVHYLVSGQAVYGDGIGYYSHLHSWVIDRDWNYTNEYRHIYDHDRNNLKEDTLAPVVQIVSTTKDGRAENFYSTGVAVLLLPFYLFAHLLSQAGNGIGLSISTTGYGDVYQILTGIGAVIYTFWGLLLLDNILRKFIENDFLSLVSVITIYLSTNLLYYGSFDVINSHFASFFLVTTFLYLLYGSLETDKNYLVLGIVAGLITTTRVQDSVIIALLIAEIASLAVKKNFTNFKYLSQKALKFLVGFTFALIPMMIQIVAVFGNPFEHPYFRSIRGNISSGGYLDIWGSLFNPVTGLFLRTPLLLFLFIYFLYMRLKGKDRMLWNLFLFFVAELFIVTVQGGWSAAAYGGRMYISCLPFFALILGKLLLEIKKNGVKFVLVFVSFFIVLNFLSMAKFIILDKGAEGGSKGTEERTISRVRSFFDRNRDSLDK